MMKHVIVWRLLHFFPIQHLPLVKLSVFLTLGGVALTKHFIVWGPLHFSPIQHLLLVGLGVFLALEAYLCGLLQLRRRLMPSDPPTREWWHGLAIGTSMIVFWMALFSLYGLFSPTPFLR